MVWGQHYLIVILPSLCLVTGIGKLSVFSVAFFHSQFNLVFKTIDIHGVIINNYDPDIYNLMCYAIFSLATTLWCTILIIYRILSVGWANTGAGGGLRVYWHVIEVLVESSILYSICLIIYVACFASNSWGENYLDIITPFARV